MKNMKEEQAKFKIERQEAKRDILQAGRDIIINTTIESSSKVIGQETINTQLSEPTQKGASQQVSKFASKDFQIFKEVHEYARSLSMCMSLNEAKEFAIKWMEQFPERDFEDFKKAYEYARSLSMCMSLNEAKEFALKQL